jgi:glycosyltransferase involved in cell wall biosynthesis
MKIAFLTPEYPHELTGASGGIGTSIKNLSESLVAKGHSVRILVYGQDKEEIFTDKDIIIQRIKNVKIKGLSWYFTRKKLEKIINQLYAEKEIDLVEAPDWTGITSFVQPKRCPLVIRLNGSDTYFCHLDNRPVKWINRFHEKRALKKATAHASVSQFTADMTNQLFGLTIPFTIIANGVTANNFQSDNLVSANPPIILYFGTLIRKKGLLELPLIFNKVVELFPTAQLHLVGRDSADVITGNPSVWKMMQALFTEEALKNVTYFGGVPYAEVKAHIQKATVCVFPTFAEAFPVSWLEAMAMKKAIVASNIGWATEMIDSEKEGILVHPKEHDGYANAIVSFLEDNAKANQLGENALNKVIACFDSEVIARKNIEFYKKVIEKCS